MGETVTVKEKLENAPLRTVLKANGEFPEIITEEESTKRVETTIETSTTPHPSMPSSTTTVLTKKVSVTTTKIRTTTPYTGTV